MAEVSIIVPVYEVERYVGECIDSVVGQSVADWELILVDDGSTDGSGAICDRYAHGDERIRVVHKRNEGVSMARNSGIDIASGRYLFFLDADDRIHPRAIELLLGIATATGCRVVAPRCDYSEAYRLGELDQSAAEVVDCDELTIRTLYQQPEYDNCICNKLYASELFENYRFSPTRYEDLDSFYLLYEKGGRIAVSKAYTYFYRRHADSFINQWSDARYDIIDVVDRLARHASERGNAMLEKAARHRQFSAYFNVVTGHAHSRRPDNATIAYCHRRIKELRRETLFDSRARFKNRVGALLAYLGSRTVTRIIRWVSRY